MRWLTGEQELKWQQLMRHNGTPSIKLCCCCTTISVNSMLTHPMTQSSNHPLSSTLSTCEHSGAVHAYKNPAHTRKHWKLPTLGRCSSHTALKSTQSFWPLVKLRYLHLSSVAFTPGQPGEGYDDRCPYRLREDEAHNESGRCVSPGFFLALLNQWLLVVSVLALLVLNSNTDITPIYYKLYMWHANILYFPWKSLCLLLASVGDCVLVTMSYWQTCH